ncbi:O-antigen ligase [Escherichia marmotae]|uniref:O-antigen polymerase n=1 Tax=Escherichia marmotae TaxID=1499973 RepID=UPI0023B356D8|nr:O-antigen polymerase [Escherichia marmotae]MDE9781021.1 O-antigen ligase [Escherichia marmotae]
MTIYKSISSPFNIIVALSIAIVLYLARLSSQITSPSFETVFYLILNIFGMLLGVILGSRLKFRSKTKEISFTPKFIPNSNRNLVILLLCISTLFFVFEHVVFFEKYGSLPIFNSNFEILRMEFPISGYIHIIAMAGLIFALPLYYDYLIYKKIWSNNQKIIVAALIIINVLLSLLVGNRGGVSLFFVQSLIIYYSLRQISFRRLLTLVILGAYLLGTAKFVRDYFFSGENIIDQVSDVWFFGDNIFLLPVYYCYVTFVMNFEILNKYIFLLNDFYLGHFSIWLPFESLINKNAYELIDLQRDILKDNFYGVLTATGFGVPYFDFGYFGVILIFILSYLLGFIFYVTYSCGKIYYIPFYSFYMTTFLTLIYTYNFNKLYIWLYLIGLFLIARLYKEKLN